MLARAVLRYLSPLLAALLTALAWTDPAHALTAAQARSLVSGEVEQRVVALNALLATADDKTVALLQAISDDAVRAWAGSVHTSAVNSAASSGDR